MNHLGREIDITINNKQYTLSRFTRKILVEWMEWANKQLPDPIQEAKKHVEGFPLELQKVFVEAAIDAKRKRQDFYSPEIQGIFRSNNGIVKALSLLFKKHHPDLSQEQIEEVIDDGFDEHGEAFIKSLFTKTNGIIPKSEQEVKEEALLPQTEAEKKGVGTIDWLKVDQTLAKEFGYKPWELLELTMTETQWLYLSLCKPQEDTHKTVVLGRSPLSRAYDALSAKERLELAELCFWY